MIGTPHALILEWYADEFATELDVKRVQKHFGIVLPGWYKRFMVEEAGSGVAVTQDCEIILAPVSSLIEANSGQGSGLDMMDYGLFYFGSNGGGTAYTFSVRSQPCGIVTLGFISSYWGDGSVIGYELEDLLGWSIERDYPRYQPDYVVERDND